MPNAGQTAQKSATPAGDPGVLPAAPPGARPASPANGARGTATTP